MVLEGTKSFYNEQKDSAQVGLRQYPRHTKVVFIPVREILSNGLELCSDEVSYLLQSVYELNGRIRMGRVLQNFEPAQNVLLSIPSYNYTEAYFKRDRRTTNGTYDRSKPLQGQIW